jgi:hypothetical protein
MPQNVLPSFQEDINIALGSSWEPDYDYRDPIDAPLPPIEDNPNDYNIPVRDEP